MWGFKMDWRAASRLRRPTDAGVQVNTRKERIRGAAHRRQMLRGLLYRYPRRILDMTLVLSSKKERMREYTPLRDPEDNGDRSRS